MKKLIIIAGSPNSGKTLSVNMAIQKLISQGASFEYVFDNKPKFWETNYSGAVTVLINGTKIALISYGDTVKSVDRALSEPAILSCDIIVCCSHATRGKKVFEYFHDYIKPILSNTQVIPIYKNLLCGYGKETLENEKTADLILSLIKSV